MVFPSSATPSLAISILNWPMVRFAPALVPNAMFPFEMLFWSAPAPTAVLLVPSTLLMSANQPTGHVRVASAVVKKRVLTDGRVVVTLCVTSKRIGAVSRVFVAGAVNLSITAEGCKSGPRVAVAGHGKECEITNSHIIDASCVVLNRVETAGCVVIERSVTVARVVAAGVAVERSVTVGRVVAAANVVGERISASSSIEKPAGVAKER